MVINVVLLYCVFNFFEMDDDLLFGNFILKIEFFLIFLMIFFWKDIFYVFKICEFIFFIVRDLQIQRRCFEVIVWKVFIDLRVIENEFKCLYGKRVVENWWFEDVLFFRIDYFIEVVVLIKRKGIKVDVLGLCIVYWIVKWFFWVLFGVRISIQKIINYYVRRVIVESLIRVFFVEENFVFCNFLLYFLKFGLMMKIDVSLSGKLEKRIVLCLE